MLNSAGYILRIIFELVIFVVIYYFVSTRWQKKKSGQALKIAIFTGVIWVIVYELIIRIFL